MTYYLLILIQIKATLTLRTNNNQSKDALNRDFIMIDLNVRSIKLTDTYKITVDRPLCNHCGAKENCKSYAVIQIFNTRYSASADIKKCGEYIFPILFVDAKGTSGKFNTIRLGEAWSRRLNIGNKVALVNKLGKAFGFAVVKSIVTGEKDEIMREHAYLNHLYLDDDKDKEEAGEHLVKRLPNIYGNLIAKSNTRATVIYLENCYILK